MQQSYRSIDAKPLEVSRTSTGDKFKLEPGSLFGSSWTGLLIIAGIGLFAYVNTSMLVGMGGLVDKSAFTNSSTAYNCNGYYCNQVVYNLIYNPDLYQYCNQKVCQETVCEGFSCSEFYDNPQYYGSANTYYACHPACTDSMADAPAPGFINSSFGSAIAAAVIYGIAVLNSIIYGIVLAILNKDLELKEKIALGFTVFFPSLKYTFIREREYWDHFTLNTRIVVLLDLLNSLIYGAVWGIYIYLAIGGFFLNAIEITCFFFTLATFMIYFAIVSRQIRPMWTLQDDISSYRIL